MSRFGIRWRVLTVDAKMGRSSLLILAVAALSSLVWANACARTAADGLEPGAAAQSEPPATAVQVDESEVPADRRGPAGQATAGEDLTMVAGSARDDRLAEDDDEDDDDDDRDYWKGVEFDVTNFDEILDYIATYYIDTAADRKRAWTEAANFALLSLDPAVELLPSDFYNQRKGLPEEEGRLDGTTSPFVCGKTQMVSVVLHELPSDEYLKAHRKPRKRGRLSNEEVHELREQQKVRNAKLTETWKPLPFGRPQFECVMAYVEKEIPKAQERIRAARVAAGNAAKAAPKNEPDGAPERPTTPAKAVDRQANARSDKTVGRSKEDPKAKPSRVSKDAKAAKDARADKAADATAPAADEERDPPTLDKAWVAAASGYLYALDPHSSIIPKRAWDESTKNTQDSSFEGIGAVLTQRDDMTIVENPMEGRPAWKAGVRAGDVIHQVDGTDVSGWLLRRVVDRIRGKKGTPVRLTVSREDNPEPQDITIVRAHIDIKNVDGKLLKEHPGIAHVKMAGFIPQSTQDLRDMIDKLSKEAPGGQLQGLVLDLRNNSGGLLNKAIDIADMFLTSGRVVSVRSRRRAEEGRRAEEVHEASRSAGDYKFPMVVLVNDGSASASEIVASAIQDNRRGLVVGLRTFGKASVQTLFEPVLHQDYYIKLTVARYYAPSGNTIQVVGVHPDVEIAPDVDNKIPVGFREENLNNHLVPIESSVESPWKGSLPALDSCVVKSGKAPTIAKREPKPQIHPDYQLLRAADYVTCLGQLGPEGKARGPGR